MKLTAAQHSSMAEEARAVTAAVVDEKWTTRARRRRSRESKVGVVVSTYL